MNNNYNNSNMKQENQSNAASEYLLTDLAVNSGQNKHYLNTVPSKQALSISQFIYL